MGQSRPESGEPGLSAADLVDLTGMSYSTAQRRMRRWLKEGWPKVRLVSLEAGGREYQVTEKSFELYVSGVYEDPEKTK